MKPNGSQNAGLAPANERRSQLVFDRMSRYVGRLSKDPAAADVHRFRTNGRRVEALVEELTPESRNQKKLLKLLAKLRKRAGKLRDLDVQISFLENLKIPDRQNHRAQLLDWLGTERARRSRKLPKHFHKDALVEIRKRLNRARTSIDLQGVNLLELAFRRLPSPTGIELNEKAMHAFRISAKRSRYLAELVDSPEASSFVEELKRAQDAIGEWHDVLKLKQKTAARFGSVNESPLVAALENITRARFRRARNTLLQSLANISMQRQPSPRPSGRLDLGIETPASPALVA